MVLTARVLPETLAAERRRPTGLGASARTFAALLLDRSFVGYVLVGSFGCAATTVYIAGSSFVFEDVYGTSPRLFGVLYGVSALAMVIGAQVNAHMLHDHSPRRLLGLGTAMMFIAAALLVVLVPFHGTGFGAGVGGNHTALPMAVVIAACAVAAALALLTLVPGVSEPQREPVPAAELEPLPAEV